MGKYREASARTKPGVTPTYTDDYVYVAPSEYLGYLKNGDLGLYANRKFYPRDVIVEYLGKKITDSQAERKQKSKQYMFDVKAPGNKIVFVLDGASNKHASAAKFVNTVLSWNDPKRNAEFVQYNQRIYLIASKMIQKGDELLSFYGTETLDIIRAK